MHLKETRAYGPIGPHNRRSNLTMGGGNENDSSESVGLAFQIELCTKAIRTMYWTAPDTAPACISLGLDFTFQPSLLDETVLNKKYY